MKEELEYVNKILTKSESTLLNNYINKLRKQIEQTEELAMKYKTRNNKSIEYIDRCAWSNGIDNEIQYSLHVPTLLNVLQGEENE